MATKKEDAKSDAPTYVVMNPRGVPEGVPIITIDGPDGDSRHYYEGDVYEGPRPEAFYEEGVLVTPKQAEAIVQTLDKEADAVADASEEEGSE